MNTKPKPPIFRGTQIRLSILLLLLSVSLLPAFASESWTLAFYLADGEHFYKEQQANVKEICADPDLKNVNIVFLHDRQKTTADKSNLKDMTYVSDCKGFIDIPDLGTETYSTETIKKFFSYVKANYRSDRYFYSITAHGMPPYMSRSGSLNALHIQQALKGIEPDVLGLDMCYLGSLESLLVLNGTADYIVSASTTLPAAGNDFTVFINYFQKHHKVSPKYAARAYLNGYRVSYKDTTQPLTVLITKTGEELNRTAGLFYDSLRKLTVRMHNRLPENPVTLFGINGDLTAVLRQMNVNYQDTFIEYFSTGSSLEGTAVYFPARYGILNKTAYGYRLFLRQQGLSQAWLNHLTK
ncbi:clostripain-related cysteine peptidase [Seleniivibrio woodruffii]|uniref:clostripain-related cysteine peptidase n=1 Tax=Seleniivibrio woodruffii TaxID=1078050 RepID=UPI00240A7B24|nr:clostripain-related cysteine peptidase [Seleniivibrio woodruffii]